MAELLMVIDGTFQELGERDRKMRTTEVRESSHEHVIANSTREDS